MVVLAGTMLLFGGGTLVGGLMTVRDPQARNAIRNVPRPPAAEEAVRKLEPILEEVVNRHRAALRADAVVSIGFGVFTLYAVAAILSRDRNGRRLALLTAIGGIVFQVAELPLKMKIASETVAAGGPLLAQIMTAAGEGGSHTDAELTTALHAAAGLFAAAGVGWCLLLLVYFGGRRGRELYGVRRS
jgi:hypothetical protein